MSGRITPLFSLYPSTCLSLSSPLLFLSFPAPPPSVFIVSHFISPLPASVFLFTRSIYPSLFLQSSSVSVFLSRCRVSPYLTSSHPSIHPSIYLLFPLTVIIHPLLSFMHFSIFLPRSLPPSTCASISPTSLSFPTEAHKDDGFSNRL